MTSNHSTKLALPSQMRAQLLEAFNTPYTLKHMPLPPPPLGTDILLRVHAASYCHTDALFARGALSRTLPRIGSHEFSGEILALGPSVPSSLNLHPGALVGVPGRAYRPCGTCHECLNNDGDPAGYGVWCPRAGNLGLTRDGGFREYALVDARQVARVPAALSAVQVAPLMCAGLTVWSALGAAGVRLEAGGGEGRTVVVVGAGGGLGHLGVQFAARLGCRVVAVDVEDGALKLAEEVKGGLGSLGERVTVVDARTEDAASVREEVWGAAEQGLEGEKGCDGALILPESQEAFDFGMAMLRNHGTCVVVSFPAEGFHMQPRGLVFRHIKLVGVLVGRNRQLKSMLQFAAEHDVRAKIKTYRLEDLNCLVEDYHNGERGKLVVDMMRRE